jgi:four helix bundle protein
MLKNFRTYQLSVTFFKECSKLQLPKYLKDQLDRASSSICLNLAEGSGKNSPKDQKRFYAISLGSLRETEAIFDLANINSKLMRGHLDHLGASLYRLITAP